MKHVTAITIIVALAVFAGAWLLWWRSGSFELPRGGETTTQIIAVKDGAVIDDNVEPFESAEGAGIKEIMVTEGMKHSVPLDEIIGGGPPKDGIPSIDAPKFVSVSEATFITDNEPGLAVSLNGMDRFYPFQIMVWHEIINDTFPSTGSGQVSQRVLVTYCPLCLSGIVFDPVVGKSLDGARDERVEFGTSGKLWNSNLVMYDRKTESLWSQILGEAIVGEMTGTKLTVLPSDQVRFGDWKKLHPQGQVLSRDTGATRFYGRDPYDDYYTDNSEIAFPVKTSDDRLENKDFVLGLVIDGKAKAYYPPAIKATGEVTDTFADKTIDLLHNNHFAYTDEY